MSANGTKITQTDEERLEEVEKEKRRLNDQIKQIQDSGGLSKNNTAELEAQLTVLEAAVKVLKGNGPITTTPPTPKKRILLEDVPEPPQKEAEVSELVIERQLVLPPPPLPLPPTKTISAQRRFVLFGLVATAVALLALSFALPIPPTEILNMMLHRTVTNKRLIAYQMAETLNSDGCALILPKELELGRFFGKYSYEELRVSMVWHMVNRNYSGICAQHVGVPICYCMLDIRRFDAEGNEYAPVTKSVSSPSAASLPSEYESGRDYLEMFNQEVVGASVDSLSKVQEANALCKESHWRTRFDVTVVSFLQPGSPPRRFRETFTGTHSYNIQHFFDIQHGQSGCRDDATDLLRGRAFNANSRSAAAQRVLLFENPAAQRTQIAPSPPPAPLPELPHIPGHNQTNA